MFSPIEHEDGQAFLGHRGCGLDGLSAGHADSTWVRQYVEWYQSSLQQPSGVAAPSLTVDTAETATGEVLSFAFA